MISFAIAANANGTPMPTPTIPSEISSGLSWSSASDPTPSAVRTSPSTSGSRDPFAVSDEGRGIPATEDLSRVFERFYRVDKVARARSRRHRTRPGDRQALIELHGGTVRAENRPEGGARFVLRI